ncbi:MULTISPECIES: hypothetical protein [unclassified Photobacterium]|uniref:hypothetical protein n=1 Tax=unclassified Photobacterium TaxID=2628852 RepID=UPI001EE12AE9|nr:MULTISPECIES: hypothetical protein [unclassified Photobacterium]MCG3864933.1 hypothetical protein [Photobacterium sp. Ph6]MCG3876341.1 hypothetical protein [Photobacterium sp. Ph5]
MPNRKMIALRTLELSYHPLLEQVIKDDYYPLTKQTQLSCLSDQEISRLLEQMTLSVVPHPNKTAQYYLLSPAADFFFIQQHPHASTLQVQLLIYPFEDAESIIQTLSFIAPSLHHGLQTKALHNLSKRHQLAKQYLKSMPSKRKLAVIANTSPSAIRH